MQKFTDYAEVGCINAEMKKEVQAFLLHQMRFRKPLGMRESVKFVASIGMMTVSYCVILVTLSIINIA